MKKVETLVAYVRMSCFDEATGFSIKKSTLLLELIAAAQKELDDE